ALDQLHQRTCASDSRRLVPGRTGRHRGGERNLWRRESRGQAADHVPEIGWPAARFLQLQAVAESQLSAGWPQAALPVRLRLELHNFQIRKRARGATDHIAWRDD